MSELLKLDTHDDDVYPLFPDVDSLSLSLTLNVTNGPNDEPVIRLFRYCQNNVL